ncbi:transcriptional regulator [Agrobacterium vitis]|uniref:LacI family DNA-binding transcriptional regulator n=1 Tax=Agrobacterium vitis TaxID=373 RepID=UPI0015DBDBF1|nr:LacI family DNA-binding transcriptional regulator [Agrobacterium vitis]BCH65238.1 transcriptional regulator [Agrobacterium vitis]
MTGGRVGKKIRTSGNRLTLNEVAEKVGVSPITISRALNKPEKVSPGLRETILKIVEELGYVPDYAARALASRNSNTIGVLSSLLGTNIFPKVMKGIEDRAWGTGLRIQYVNTRYDPDEELYQLRQFFAQKPTGIIIGGVQVDPRVTEMLHDAPCPVVQFIDISYPPVDMAIGINNAAAADVAIRHLLDVGYRRIAFCSTGTDIPVRMRLESYRNRLREAGLYNPDLEVNVDANDCFGSAGKTLDTLFAADPEVDAVLCCHDDLALGLLFECQRRGISIPDRLGLCSFTDLDYCAHTVPGLTTVRTPLYQLGYRATDMIIRSQDKIRQKHTTDLGFELIARGSTRRPKP